MNSPEKLPAIQSHGRISKAVEFTPLQAKQAAKRVLQSDISNLRNTVLSLLYEFSALTEETLFRLVAERVAISENRASFRRRLNDYEGGGQRKGKGKEEDDDSNVMTGGLVERLSADVLKQARRAGLPEPSSGIQRAYRLGPVGVEVARMKFVTEDTGPLVSNDVEDFLAHDLICAEAMLRMAELWPVSAKPGKVEVRGPRSVTLWDAEERKAIISPDGLIIKYKLDTGEFERAYLIEYHNSNAKMHVKNKLAKYEKLAGLANTWLAWGLSEMPIVVVLYRQPSVLEHYREEIRKRGETRATYAGQSLAAVWDSKLTVAVIKPA